MSGLPPGLATERVFVIEGHYAADAATRREPVRAEHLTRVAAGTREGRVLLAGGLEDMSRSLLVLRADDEAAARAWAEDDVYLRTGVWTSVDVRPLIRIIVGSGAE